uniref:Dual specificity protein phosphatase 23 n=1 Tax=Lepeophtheirus salmonis TaxID=72036 RepID=A0A0K2U4U5_LEPSM
MGPNRFKREKRESTPFNDEPIVREEVPPEWRDIEAPINFTWVAQDELAGMGWPKSRDQVRFCVEQGIDHLISLSPEKLPPSYAFPNLKWTLIPVEDFTGPTIADIKKFITIMDEARKEGEAIGVHCAEGRGRTGVLCACYLIYYHEMKPWDAIRIMRRQRPGSVERKTQEETVVRFWTLIQDYGKSKLEELEERDKELRRKQKLMSLNNSLTTCTTENPLLGHTAKFFGPNSDARSERRCQRAKSMPKFNQEEEEEVNFRQHMQSFFQSRQHRSHRHERRSRSQPHGKRSEKNQNSNRNERATTPGRSLVENLKPVHQRTRKLIEEPASNQNSNDLTKHFKDFMNSSSSINKQKARKPPRHPNKSVRGVDENDANIDNICIQEKPMRSQSSSKERKYIRGMTETETNTHRSEKETSCPPSRSSSRSESPSMSEDSCSSDSCSNSSSRCSSRRNSTCSSIQGSSSRSSSPYTSSSSSSEFSSSKKVPNSPPSFKPTYTVENISSTTYDYYTRIRSRAAANRTESKKPMECYPSITNIPSQSTTSDSRFRRAQTELSDRPYTSAYSTRNYSSVLNNYDIDQKYLSNRNINSNSPYNSSSSRSITANSIVVDRALSSLRCGNSSNILNRRFRTDKTLEYPTPLVRDSWKRTNQRFNYSRFVSTSPETFV